jgi:RNA-dependent RNA polymerase
MDHTSIQRPRSRNYPNGPQLAPIMLRPRYEWKEWPEVTIRVRGLHPQETTHNLFKNFKEEGHIVMVELFEGRDGRKDGTGLIRFCPPPLNQFWMTDGLYELTMEEKQTQLQYQYRVSVSLDEKRKGTSKVQSPIKKHIFYEPKLILHPTLLQFGLMVGPKAVMPLHTLQGAKRNVAFTVDLLHNRIVAHFDVEFQDLRRKGDLHLESTDEINRLNRVNKYMFQVSFSQITSIGQFNIDNNSFELVLSLESPPPFFRKRTDDEAGHADENLVWSEFDTWYRQTDVVYDPNRLHRTKITLHKEKPVIDIGNHSYS